MNTNKAGRKWRQKKKNAGVENERLKGERHLERELQRQKIFNLSEEANSLRQESSALIDKNDQVR